MRPVWIVLKIKLAPKRALDWIKMFSANSTWGLNQCYELLCVLFPFKVCNNYFNYSSMKTSSSNAHCKVFFFFFFFFVGERTGLEISTSGQSTYNALSGWCLLFSEGEQRPKGSWNKFDLGERYLVRGRSGLATIFLQKKK